MTCAFVEVAEFHKHQFVKYLQEAGFAIDIADDDRLKLIMTCAAYFDEHKQRQTITSWLDERIQV